MSTIPASELITGLTSRDDDDEGLFSRDINGQLVRLDTPTEGDYNKLVTLQIDGTPVTVPLARPTTDADGNIVVDLEGRTTPHYTTIYEAAQTLYIKEAGDEAKIPIPILCHQPHMKPVAVCRLCVVQIYGQKRGKRAAERKLLPACQHQVKEGMEVFTMNAPGPDGDRVRGTVKVMTEMLASDHLKATEPPELADELSPFNELGQMLERCEADAERYRLDVLANPAPRMQLHANRRAFDASSPVFLVDHSACILCERCIRACDDVRENQVIGRTGKGANAGISFDFNDAMGQSSCVKCGECMVSCPTSAITFKPVAQIKLTSANKNAEVLPARELIADPMFSRVPPKFLLWQKGLVIKRRVKAGDVLCRQGDPGNTAYLIKSGEVRVQVYKKTPPPAGGLLGRLLAGPQGRPVLDVKISPHKPEERLVGEMACLTGTPRTATITATADGEIWEMRRNVLDRLMRVPNLRKEFERTFRDRSLDLVLQGTDLFRDLPGEEFIEIVKFLRQRLSSVSVKPGQTLFEQGDRVADMYLVRLGYVRVGVRRYGNESKVVSCGPGTMLGEIALLGFTPADAGRLVDEVEETLVTALNNARPDITTAIPSGTRSATCTALGYVELARLARTDFLEMVRRFPLLRRRLVEQSLSRLRTTDQGHPLLRDYVEQGLYEGQSLLVLDPEKCTRCDECTKGCVQQHGTDSHGQPVTRLLRDGLRFENFLIATSCRSCTDPHCMSGCPVDSIHRGRHLQIVIEDHCIGCGLCAENCPYGNIFIMPNENRRIDAPDPDHPGRTISIAQPKAVTCDLCDPKGERATPDPRCVAACPHEAAFRMTGEELLDRVMLRHQGVD